MTKIFTTFDLTNDIIRNAKSTITETAWGNGSGIITTIQSQSFQPNIDYHLDILISGSNDTQFSIGYGHRSGSFSHDGSPDDKYNVSAVNYAQYISLLGYNNYFNFGNVIADDIYFITFNRDRYKQQLDNLWELTLTSGSYSRIFTNDSTVNSPDISIGGTSYNIVSGSLSGGVSNVNDVYGKVYHEHGLLLFNSAKIRTEFNIPNTIYMQEQFFHLINNGANFKMRNKQQINSSVYFVRIKNQDYNYSNNPSFTSGSYGDLKYNQMGNTPEVFITTVGLYNQYNELLAVAKLSKPIKKDFNKELLLRIKLQF